MVRMDLDFGSRVEREGEPKGKEVDSVATSVINQC
jgi:AhpD family alkylhydroperoxidase